MNDEYRTDDYCIAQKQRGFFRDKGYTDEYTRCTAKVPGLSGKYLLIDARLGAVTGTVRKVKANGQGVCKTKFRNAVSKLLQAASLDS